MKSTLITLSILCVFTSSAQDKSEPTRIESNGVKVYQAIGVEDSSVQTYQSVTQELNPVRNLEDWNLEDCENALYYIDLKINSLVEEEGSVEEIEKYIVQIAAIETRKQQLIKR